MMLSLAVLAGVVEGRIDLAFRRWERPRVRAGGRQRTSAGIIGFESVEPATREAITDDDARRSGFDARDQLLSFLDRRSAGEIYRIRLRWLGPDPRVALRESVPDDGELTAIERRLARLDGASRHGPWTRATLEAIAAHPSRRAPDLAAAFGRETRPFKADVRKLKELGLTESLRIGYRLSPRGKAVRARLAGSAAAEQVVEAGVDD
jgi:hypothetical protein